MTQNTEPPSHAAPWGVAFAAVVAAFGTYFCMYAFRKPFTAATYSGFEKLWGVDFKTVLVVAQVFGYMVSKFVGIRYIAEIQPHHRVRSLLIQIGLAEVSLLLFAITPAPWNALWLFANGLMLGMIFGLVMGFLEGRRNTEALLSALCISFIIADGAVKSVGSWILDQGVPEVWMPFTAGLLFVLPLIVCCAILKRIPPPDSADVVARTERMPMTATDRKRFFQRYGFGLVLIVLVYLVATILRSIRADFSPEIWAGLGVNVEGDPGIFTRSELVVGSVILPLFGSMIFIRNNRTAFFTALGLAWFGLILTALVAEAVNLLLVTPFQFVVLLGFGIYLPYIAVHTTVFERFIAMTRDRGTIGYLMYLADAFGYLGYVAVLLARQATKDRSSEGMLLFLLVLCTVMAIAGAILMVPAVLYFRRIRSAV
jgi:hypothetical protein